MKNRFISLCAVLVVACILLFTVISVCADTYPSRVMDKAGLLTHEERAELETVIRDLGDIYDIDVIIYFVRDKYPTNISIDLLEDQLYRDSKSVCKSYAQKDDAIVYYMSLDGKYKDYFFYRDGRCEDALEDGYEVEYLEEKVKAYMTRDDFYGAATEFLSVTREAMMRHERGESISHVAKEESKYAGGVWVIVISAAIALISVFVMKSKLKTVRPKRDAAQYVNIGSFDLRVSSDIYLYSTVTRMRKSNNGSSGGRGGSGGGRSGGGRC